MTRGLARASMGSVVTLSLRQRVLWWILAIHAAAFGFEFAVFGRNLTRTSEQESLELAGGLVGNLRSQIRPEGGLNAARILGWEEWNRFEDALILDGNLALAADGAVVPQGIALNPLGSSRRGPEFDATTVYSNMYLAQRTGRAVDDVAGGRVLPIDMPGGVWGTCWYRIDRDQGRTTRLVRTVLVLFGVTTLLIAATLYIVLRNEVLGPVARLTAAARRVASGDLEASVEPPAREGELRELARAFNGMVGEVRDFNSRLEREVRDATEQARAAEQAAMAERRLAATGKLAAGVAHEINNPLGGLLNAVERLRREDLPPQKRAQYFELLAGGLERIRDTVGKLLRLTPRQSTRAVLSLSVPALDAIGLVRHRASRVGVTLTISDGRHSSDSENLPDELARTLAALPGVMGDANELGQAILNLLVNALDALETRGGGRIDVVLRSGYVDGLGACVLLDVHDDGPGVSREELPRLLDPFYTTKDAGKGTGLGLSLVHSVVIGHGGRLELGSERGRGFHVRITMPAREQEG
ncbi:MAG: HAMP domain-containing histidine kinase [Planctomycetes bacterium]|nr:HAMP domain-containing histidine kinase [Planctomycetota bacterium]